MDVEKMREIIYYPLKQQKLPKCIKRNFDKFSVSTYALLHPYEMYQFKQYLNDLLDKICADYNLSEYTDTNMYINAVKLGSVIYNK